ncbi:hypothetical protein [Arthrobacter sp. CAN_C5]|uniref:hypothetical protein n=1 Tax=Arthrobacter sp. CAN_C5 TaxID=2760706 RepID=UPI001AE90AEA|nr:hypothetical protein [Arthrobacter sp. CAN_C5]MBP2218320.1 hypothetical protein [Arthrobacter sp. CAN_C5]
MKKLLPIAILVLAAAGITVGVVFSNLLTGLAWVALALGLWAYSATTAGRATPGGANAGPTGTGPANAAKVCQYREEHPDATIMDAVRATRAG